MTSGLTNDESRESSRAGRPRILGNFRGGAACMTHFSTIGIAALATAAPTCWARAKTHAQMSDVSIVGAIVVKESNELRPRSVWRKRLIPCDDLGKAFDSSRGYFHFLKARYSCLLPTCTNRGVKLRSDCATQALRGARDHTVATNCGMGRGCAMCSNPDARRKSVGSLQAAPKKESPIGNLR